MAGPVAGVGAVGGDGAEGDQHGQQPGRPEGAEDEVAGALVAGVEVRRVDDHRDDGDEPGGRDHEPLGGHHHVVADDGDVGHDAAEDRVADEAQDGAVVDVQEGVQPGGQRIAAGPDGQRGEREGGRRLQAGADQPADHAVERAAGDGVVRAGPRAEEAHGREQDAADDRSGEDRRARRPPAEAERHGEPADDEQAEGQAAAEQDQEEVARARLALVVGDRLDAVALDLEQPVADVGQVVDVQGGVARRRTRGVVHRVLSSFLGASWWCAGGGSRPPHDRGPAWPRAAAAGAAGVVRAPRGAERRRARPDAGVVPRRTPGSGRTPRRRPCCGSPTTHGS